MLTRLSAAASAFVLLGATLTVILPATAARADCTVKHKVAYCDASDSDQQKGSDTSGKNGDGDGGDTGPGAGCPDGGNGTPGEICTAGAPAAVQQVSSADLASQARGALPLPAPQIHWSPNPRTYVQLRTGLWVAPADFAVFDKVVAAPNGGQTVTAHATPKYVEWNLVETTIRCQNAGSADGTACGYTYQRASAGQPDGTYHITATITWGITWDCVGACDPAGGVLDDISMASTAQIPVDEIQTESQPG